MKSLKLFTGGHPLKLDDLVHVQDGFKEALIAMMKGLLTNGTPVPNCILFGCTFTQYGTSSFFDISTGAVVLDGEICLFGGVIGIDLDAVQMVWTPLDTYPVSNPVAYLPPTTPKNVHLDRKAQMLDIGTATIASNQLAVAGVKRFTDIMKLNLFNQKWRYVSSVGEPVVFLNGFVNGYQWNGAVDGLRFRKEADSRVTIQGAIDYTPLQSVSAVDVYLNICVLPALHRPDKAIFKALQVATMAGVFGLRLRVLNTGILSVCITSIPSGYSIADIASGSPFGEDFEITFAVAV